MRAFSVAVCGQPETGERPLRQRSGVGKKQFPAQHAAENSQNAKYPVNSPTSSISDKQVNVVSEINLY
jgi:hypothetical protein